jgi:hypothetical protein
VHCKLTTMNWSLCINLRSRLFFAIISIVYFIVNMDN